MKLVLEGLSQSSLTQFPDFDKQLKLSGIKPNKAHKPKIQMPNFIIKLRLKPYLALLFESII